MILSKRAEITIAAIITLLAVCGFSATLVHAVWYAPDADTRPPATLATSTLPVVNASEKPASLIIPSLSINAHVQDVGVTEAGNLGVPNNFTDVAWYQYGPVPGGVGSAVIDGHVDNGLSLAGVFKHLDKVQNGADIFVQTVDGTKLHFVVDGVELYPYTNLPTKQIFDQTGDPRLVLITCTGGWLQSGRTYDHRLVVYAKLVPN